MSSVLPFTGPAAQLAEEMARPPMLEPGIYPHLSMADYLALPYVSAGALAAINRSPAHGRAYVERPEEIKADDSTATIVGTALHCALIEPDTFPHLYARGPAGNWTNKAPKDEVARMRAESPGVLVLKPHKYDAILAARAALLGNPAVASIMEATTGREVSIVWDCPETGVRLKARPDLVLGSWDCIVDLKTTIDASLSGFAREIAKWGYDSKAALYLDGLNEIYRAPEHPPVRPFDSFVFIAAETTEPFASATYQLEPESIEAARAHNRRLLRLWAECEANGEWPGYDDSITMITTPAWRQAQLEAV